MAKTAAAKAEAAQDKAERNPTPANVAAAAKATAVAAAVAKTPDASAKEIKQIGNAAAAAVKETIVTLKDTQALEVAALKDVAGKTAAQKQAAANKTDFTNALNGLLANKFVLPTDFSRTVTYDRDSTAGSAVEQRLTNAITTAGLMNVTPGLKATGMSSSGISLQAIDKRLQNYAENETYGNTSLGKVMDQVLVKWAGYRDPKTGLLTIPASEINDAGKLKDMGDGLFKIAVNTGTGGNINRTTQYFRKDESGNFVLQGTDKYNFDDAPEQSGLLGNLSLSVYAASLIPGMQWLAPYANALSMANAIKNEDPLGLLLSSVGFTDGIGLTNINIAQKIGSVIPGVTNPAVQKALGNALIGAARNKQNPFAGAVVSGAASYLGDAWTASKGDLTKFGEYVANGIDTGQITQADYDQAMNEVALAGPPAGYVDYNGIPVYDPYADLPSVDLPPLDLGGGGGGYDGGGGYTPTGVTSQPGPYGNQSVPNGGTAGSTAGTGLFDGIDDIGQLGYANQGGYQYQPTQQQTIAAEGEFNKELSRIQSEWESGKITEAEAMRQIRYLNDLATSGEWSNYVADIGAGFTQTGDSGVFQGGGTSLWDKSIAAIGGLTGLTAGNVLSTGAGLIGDIITGESAKDAAETLAEEQTKIANMMRFRPVGVTTRFGESKFGYDKSGNLIYAGYDLKPDIKAQQDRLMTQSGNYLTQYEGAKAATAPMGTAAAGMMTLGQNYLKTTPEEQAALYMKQQQALLDPANKAEYAALQNKLLQQGRLGLATGGEGGLMATNPELAAYQNKLEMQQRQLAAASTQGGMDYAKFGSGMVGAGGDLLKQMYGTQTAAFQPYQTALGGAVNLENLGKGAMDIGTSIGAQQSTANAQVGNMMNQAAQTNYQANAYSPWGALLSGAGSMLGTMTQPQQQQQIMYNPYTGARLI